MASPQKVLVIGLDGAIFDLIKPWVTKGHLPNFARLLAEGTRLGSQTDSMPRKSLSPSSTS